MRPSDFVAQLDADQRQRFERSVRAVRVRKGQIVLGQGAAGTDVFFIRTGQFQAMVHSASGKEVSLRTLKPGDLFGELAALDLGERSASVIALSDGQLDQLSGPSFKALLLASPKATIWLAARLARQIRSLTERIFELSALDVRSRLHCELFRLGVEAGPESNRARIQPAPTHSEIASRIGTHREAVTRELGELVKRGLIRQARRELTILDLTALAHAIHTNNGERVGIFRAPRSTAELPIQAPGAR